MDVHDCIPRMNRYFLSSLLADSQPFEPTNDRKIPEPGHSSAPCLFIPSFRHRGSGNARLPQIKNPPLGLFSMKRSGAPIQKLKAMSPSEWHFQGQSPFSSVFQLINRLFSLKVKINQYGFSSRPCLHSLTPVAAPLLAGDSLAFKSLRQVFETFLILIFPA